MCGIVGHAVPPGRSPDVEAVSTGMAAMHHRGPDGEGIATFAHACLGHRRLSIIDVAGSPQPWRSADGRHTIVFNGEIYNYVELRETLEKAGVSFRSRGDTEVLLAMYVREGAACLPKLNGMFAFAVWDERDQRLFLARDRVGKKPLYYALGGHGLAFASELEALGAFAHIDRGIDVGAVQDFFAHQFIGGERSIYRGVKKLPAAHCLTYHEGQVRRERYWSPPRPDRSPRPVPDLCEELTALLDDAVRLRLRSDVPLGAFLSGGIDSALIVACMKRAGADVDSFTVGFREESFDESAQARAAADFFSTRHHARTLDMELPGALERCFSDFGEPFADPSALPTGHLCRHTREFVTVALSGDGVDELFGGYRRYYARRWLEGARRLPRWLRGGIVTGTASRLPEGDAYYGRSRVKQMKLFAHMLKAQDESPRDPLAQVYTLSERRALLHDAAGQGGAHDHIGEYGLDGLDPLSQMMFADLHRYLTDDILVKVDRMSMRHSLEVRSPFLDYRIVEFACRLPPQLKIRGPVQKYLIRGCFRHILPPPVLARGKHGFAVPLARWFRGGLRPMFETVVLNAASPEFMNRTEIRRLWEEHQAGRADHGFRLWCLLAFYYWYVNRRTGGR